MFFNFVYCQPPAGGSRRRRNGFINTSDVYKHDVGIGGNSTSKPLLHTKIKGGTRESAFLLQKHLTDIVFINFLNIFIILSCAPWP